MMLKKNQVDLQVEVCEPANEILAERLGQRPGARPAWSRPPSPAPGPGGSDQTAPAAADGFKSESFGSGGTRARAADPIRRTVSQ